MNSDLSNLTEIFNEKFFRIPDYQRGYSWESKLQIEDFWEDLQLLSENDYHYTGLLTYEKIKKIKNNDDNKLIKEYGLKGYYLIDGQQRLTTILILLKELLDNYKDDELIGGKTKKEIEIKFLYKVLNGYDYFIFGYDIDNPSDYFFKKNILERAVSDEERKQDTIYTRNLQSAKTYFNNKLKGMKKEEMTTLTKKLINQLKFNTYEVGTDLEVYVTFETMNNRGKSLSKLEILKNRLIYLCEKSTDNVIDKEKLREEINDSWKKIYNYLGKNPNNILDDDEFLQNHWIMYFPGYNRNEASAYSIFLLKEYFSIKKLLQGNLKTTDIKKYVESLKISIENYYFILNPDYNSDKSKEYEKSCKYLEKLNRLGFSSFKPLIMAMLNKKINDSELETALKTMEEFIFTIFDIGRYLSNFKNATFYRYAHEYTNESKDLTSIIKEIKTIKEENTNLNLFKEWILNKFNRNGQGYYDWYDELKYLLYEYELNLKDKNGINEDKLSWKELNETKKDYVSIEHIFPQSKIITPQDKLNCHSLGNLVPLSIKKNSKLQDKAFKEKCKDYKNGSLSERELCEYDQFGEEQIKERGLKLINFMLTRWDIKQITDLEKIQLLGYTN